MGERVFEQALCGPHDLFPSAQTAAEIPLKCGPEMHFIQPHAGRLPRAVSFHEHPLLALF